MRRTAEAFGSLAPFGQAGEFAVGFGWRSFDRCLRTCRRCSGLETFSLFSLRSRLFIAVRQCSRLFSASFLSRGWLVIPRSGIDACHFVLAVIVWGCFVALLVS